MAWPDLTKRSNAIWILLIADAILFVVLMVCYAMSRFAAAIPEVKGVFEGYNGALFLALNITREAPGAPPTSSVPVNGG